MAPPIGWQRWRTTTQRFDDPDPLPSCAWSSTSTGRSSICAIRSRMSCAPTIVPEGPSTSTSGGIGHHRVRERCQRPAGVARGPGRRSARTPPPSTWSTSGTAHRSSRRTVRTRASSAHPAGSMIQPGTVVAINTGRPESMRGETLESLNALGASHRVRFDPGLLFMRNPDVSVRAGKNRGAPPAADRASTSSPSSKRTRQPARDGRRRSGERCHLAARRDDLRVAAPAVLASGRRERIRTERARVRAGS